MSSNNQLRALTRAMSEFRKLYADIPVTTVEVFLAVAVNSGISSKDLRDRVGASQSAVSRHLALLGEYSWRGGEGMDLIEIVEDPEDRRSKLAFLKPKGQTLAIRLSAILDPQGDDPQPSDFLSAADHVKNVRGGAR